MSATTDLAAAIGVWAASVDARLAALESAKPVPVPTPAPAPGPAPAPAGTRQVLTGIYNSSASPTISSWLGQKSDFTINNSFQDSGLGKGVSGLSGINGYPVIVALDLGATHYNATPADYQAAAAGKYAAQYLQTVQALVPFAGSVYAVRIDPEFNLHGQGSPWQTAYTVVGPAIYIAAFNALADICRQLLPNAKIIWNPNIQNGADTTPYYPGKGALVGVDVYMAPQWKTTFASYKSGTNSLDAFVALAKANNVAWGLCECADLFPDTSNGDQLFAYAKANGATFIAYWNSTDDLTIGGTSGNVSPVLVGAKQASFVKAFGNSSYSGSFWAPPKPPTNLPGY